MIHKVAFLGHPVILHLTDLYLFQPPAKTVTLVLIIPLFLPFDDELMMFIWETYIYSADPYLVSPPRKTSMLMLTLLLMSSLQLLMYSLATCSRIQYVLCNIQCAKCKIHLAKINMPNTKCKIRYANYNSSFTALQLALGHNMHNTICKIQHAKCYMQNTLCKMQNTLGKNQYA